MGDSSEQVLIHRLTARVRGAEPGTDASGAWRVRLGYLLGTADLSPPGLPPSAVLLVRRVADPAPGQLVTDPQAIAADARWAGAVRTALGEQWRSAVRPVGGWVPGGAGAVWFADWAELVACLALGAVRGARGDWWFSTALRALPGAAPVPAAILGHQPQRLPAVLAHLHGWGAATAVLRTLSAGEALGLVLALGRSHDLPTWGDWQVGVSAPAAGSRAEDGDRPGATSLERTAPRPVAAATAPWAALIPGGLASAGLTEAAEALQGVALALHHRPGAVRTPLFGVRLRAWWAARASGGVPAAPGTAALATAGGPPPPAMVAGPEPGPAVSFAATVLEGAAAASALAPETGNAPPGAPPPVAPPAALASTPTDAAPPTYTPETSPPRDDRPTSAAQTSSGTDEMPTLAAQPQPVTDLAAVETQVGGVLYLLNLMGHLDLPDAFEEDWRLASEVGAWGVLELLGRALLGPDSADVASDPLWAMLARLDGRLPGVLPGAAYAGPKTAAVPSAWLQHLGGGEPIPEAMESPLLQGLNPHLARWLELVLPHLRRRLQGALRDAPIAPLLRVRGRLYVSAGHVDLVMAMADIALPIRLAGLDANPGWMMFLGRTVKFHYE